MSTENTKPSAYPIFAFNFNNLIGYKGKADRKARSAAAEKLGVKYENIRVWSEGLYLPKGEALLKIKEKYKISIDKLLTGHDPSMEEYWQGNEEIKILCDEIKEIIGSGDAEIISALTQNIKEFKKSIDKDKKMDNMERELKEIRRVLAHLKKTTSPGRDGGTLREPAMRTAKKRKAG